MMMRTRDYEDLDAWERAYAYERSWEALQEDESGLLRPILPWSMPSIAGAFAPFRPWQLLLVSRRASFAIFALLSTSQRYHIHNLTPVSYKCNSFFDNVNILLI
jgi:hypothetical protein